jgi:hypothetical protein
MCGQLHLDKDFTAEENVHANIPKKPITDSEGATSDDLTMQAKKIILRERRQGREGNHKDGTAHL